MNPRVSLNRVLLQLVLVTLLPLAVQAQRGGDGDGSGPRPFEFDYGCINANCNDTGYPPGQDPGDFWHDLCSQCHQISRPAGARRADPAELTAAASQPARFWRFHEASVDHRYWQPRLQQFRRPVDVRRLSADFKRLMAAQPRK